jgi:hypothetical protein
VLLPDGVDVIVIVDEGGWSEPGVSVGGGARVGGSFVGVALAWAMGTGVLEGTEPGVGVRVTGALVGGRVAVASVGVFVDG